MTSDTSIIDNYTRDEITDKLGFLSELHNAEAFSKYLNYVFEHFPAISNTLHWKEYSEIIKANIARAYKSFEKRKKYQTEQSV